MRFIKWIVWDGHQPKVRWIMAVAYGCLGTSMLMVSILGWISIFGG